MLKAIETVYKGYRFRSRLEARWAVFFDTLGIVWEYEVEGFELETGDKYLPDFLIPQQQKMTREFFIECKPDKNPTKSELMKCASLADKYPIFMFLGQPEIPNLKTGKGSWAISFPVTVEPKNARFIFMADPRPWCWHERSDGTFLIWPVPANEPHQIDDKWTIHNPLSEGTKRIDSPRLLKAYEAARSARFEFGR